MLSISNLNVVFGGETLLDQLSFKINIGDRIGLIGKNGSGKSTLLKILAQESSHFQGEIAVDKGVTVGLLKQQLNLDPQRTLLEECYQVFSLLMEIESKQEYLNNQLLQRTDYESESYASLINELAESQQVYEINGGYQYIGETEKILLGLGFQPEDWTKKLSEFSGGWQIRVELAKILLQKPDVLFLDEPTNHLDMEAIIWLEKFLKTYKGAIVIVSHDKMFLDNLTNRTIEISQSQIIDYKKPYSQFIVLRQELKEHQLANFKNQQKYIKQTEQLIEKFRAKASKATMAQSLIKKLDRLDKIELEDEDLSQMKIQFQVSSQPGKIVLELHHISKSYGSNSVISQLNLAVNRNEKIAFVGQNGQGKTTLAKIIMNQILYEGDVTLGHQVQLGYFAQNQSSELDLNKTVLDTLLDAANDTNRVKVRDILGAFLFKDDAVHKKVKVLSGGEKNRLALAKLLLQPFNVLIMDEPTNHLDMKAKEVLKMALQKYNGTLILVSHDRDFLQGLTDKVIEFKDGKIKPYLGDINTYLESRELDHLRALEIKKKSTIPSPKASSASTPKDSKSLKNKLSKLENKISIDEKKVIEMEKKLENQPHLITENPEFLQNYEKLKLNISSNMEAWEKLSLELES